MSKDFKIGDKVLVMDEAISGIITAISGSTISLQTEDEFIMEFSSKELLKIDAEASMKSELFASQSANSVISEKEEPLRKHSPKVKPKERNNPAMEIDLHIHQLTTNDKRMSNYEMLTLQLDTAKRQLEFAIRNRIQKIVFIHGVGEGVLRTELEYMVNRFENVKFYDAEYQKYGLGAMEVYIFQNVN